MNQELHGKEILEICLHEAGHAITAHFLGFTVGKITLRFYTNGGHKCEAGLEIWNQKVEGIDALVIYLEKRIQILMAGAIAEHTTSEGTYNGPETVAAWHNGNAMNDWAKIRELIQLLQIVKYPDAKNESVVQNNLNQIESSLGQAALDRIEQNIQKVFQVGHGMALQIQEFDKEYEFSMAELLD